jgi:hypothetical protein
MRVMIQLDGDNGNTNSVAMDDGMMITQLMLSLHMAAFKC